MKTQAWAMVYLLALSTSTLVWAKSPATEQVTEVESELEAVEVISTTPLSPSPVKAAKIPSHVQTVSAQELKKSQSLSLADYMNQYLGSVTINETQSNPLQPDVYYRGFVASPLMGMPQGLSVYVNGTRFNEPFGDSVNWDLLPQNAIQSVTLSPGSNPVYGLNTLGGALSVRTKTGFDFAKLSHQLEVSGGSWGRHSEDLSSGGRFGDSKQFGYFIDLNYLNEDGWRDFSGTEAKRALASLSWHGDKGKLDLTIASNDNKMLGNGALPIQLYEQDSNAIFTHPDQTINRLFFSQLEGSYDLSKTIKFSGNAYFRQNQMSSFNGDNGYAACETTPDLLCTDSADITTTITDMDDNTVAATDNVTGAINNKSQTKMRGHGGSLQALFSPDVLGFKNNLTIGASYDNANVHYAADTELASLTDTRGTVGSGTLTQDDHVRLNTNTETYGFYFTDSFDVSKNLTLTLAGRYNHTTLTMNNQYINGIDKLSGKHSYDRFNPSAGLTYQVNHWLNAYANYSESARVPTPMELSCADVNDPCKLPNAFIADPPLAQVVAKTWETGLRGSLKPLLSKADSSWNLGFFHTVNHKDIIFRRDGNNISSGFFSNVGSTRRYGIEAGLSVTYPQLFSTIDDWHFSTNYTYLNARFMNGFAIQDPLDPTVGAKVTRGNRIPGLPEHVFKASVGVELWKTWSLSVNGMYNGDQFFRGDEANSTAALTGYWLFNLHSEIKVNDNFAVFARVNNLFDHRYETFGVYGNASEVLPGYDDRRFVSPGAPRAAWVGVRLSL